MIFLQELHISMLFLIFTSGLLVLIYTLIPVPGQYFKLDNVKNLPLWRSSSVRSSSEPCSFEILRKFVRESSHFPKEGNWTIGEKNATYQPDICKFQHQEKLPGSFIEQCFRDTGTSRILILGDSNGARYDKATEHMLSYSGFHCKVLKREKVGFMPDPKYFAQGTNIKEDHIVVHTRDCHGCTSRKMSCTKSSLVIEVEYVAMEFLLDSEVTTQRKHISKDCPHAPLLCPYSPTHQQFLFEEYLEGNYPDLILLFGNNHDIRRRTLPQMKSDMVYLLGLIQRTVPKSTKLVWFGTHGEELSQKPKVWQREIFQLPSGNLTPNAMVDLINEELFSVLQPELLRRDTNIFPFLDMPALSRAVRIMWSTTGGLHMQPPWYEHVTSFTMQIYCNSGINGQDRNEDRI